MMVQTILYSWKTVFRYSCIWTIVLVFIALLSSFSVYLQVKTLEQVINQVSNRSELTSIYYSVGLWAGTMILMNLFTLTKKYLSIHINEQLERNYIPVIINKYEKLNFAEFEKKDSQNLLHNISSNSQEIVLTLFHTSIAIVTSIITLGELIAVFWSASLIMGIIASGITVPLLWISLKATYIEMRQRWTMTSDIRKRYYFQSLFADKDILQEIKIFHSEDYFIEESEKLTVKINQDLKKNIGKVFHLNIISTILISIFVTTVIIISSFLIVNSQLSVGTYVILMECIVSFYGSEKVLASNSSQIVRNSEQVQYLFNFFKLPEQTQQKISDSLKKPLDKNILIEFSHVFFSYPDCTEFVLKDISFKISEGEIISFVGENGSGKSTIVKLMCGLYPPSKGTIKISGIPIEQVSNELLMHTLSSVFQDGEHYMMTIRENVGLGNIDAIHCDKLIMEALQKAGAIQLAASAMGLEQPLGNIDDLAVDLSGGEWQRLVIARSFFSKSKLVILDEPTASLDPMAESDLYRSLQNTIRNSEKAAVLISHRLASGKLADCIFVLRNGSIIEYGSHKKLMESDGYYANMFNKQKSWYEE